MKSPPRGCSILMTSAPCSPNRPAQNGAAIRVPRSRTRTPSSAPVTGGLRSLAPLLLLHRVHAAGLARLDLGQRGRRVRDELMQHEVIAPRLALAHTVDHVVDRRLDRLGGERRDERDLAG